ncbi:MAG: tetratricopeptide repeat protein [Candidatus Obscuribacterales bacterium]
MRIGISFLLAVTMLITGMAGPAEARKQTDLEIGKELFHREKLTPALKYLNRAVNEEPLNKESFLYRGRALHYLDRPKAAIKDLNHSLELDPKYSEAYLWRGETYLFMDDYPKAVADFDKALKLRKAEATWPIYIRRAKAYHMEKKSDLAVADITAAIQARTKAFEQRIRAEGKTLPSVKRDYDKDMKEFHSLRGQIYYNQEKFDQAAADLTAALSAGGFSDQIYLMRAKTYERAGKTQLALKDYTKLIEVNPDDEAAYEKRANLLMKAGRTKEAVSDLDRAIANYPGHAPARLYKLRGQAHHKLGNKALESADLRKANTPDWNAF